MITATTITLILLAGILGAMQDRLSTLGEFSLSILKSLENRWLGPKQITWTNKYRKNNPLLGGRFPGATGPLVFFTDGWHFFKTCQLLCFSTAIALNAPLVIHFQAGFPIHPLLQFPVDVLLYKALMGSSFHFFYSYILSMNFWKNLRAWMYEMNFLKAILILIPVFVLLVLGTESLNRLDPRFDPADHSTTFLGDYVLVTGYLATGLILAWHNFRKKGGHQND